MGISAFVLIDVSGDRTKSAYKTITRMEGVQKIYAVTGPYDLIVQIEAESIEHLNELVLSRIRSVDGVIKTSTAIVLKS
ncbi:MAG: Lrp/AsnC ligand binding domain-containing protein [Nitrospirae bacterium]|jgi:DNA-binding Lrp family transcriptional regulator|nr:Lrp/AsnC ligand binding domain-containing protein [Nitrospirota bacterium]